MLITHDLGVVAEMATDVAVMYLGRVVEQAPVDEIFHAPKHPYTQALLSAVPVPDPDRQRSRILLGGELPSPSAPPPGCPFHPRCPHAFDRCKVEVPPLYDLGGGHTSACFLNEGERKA